MTDDTDISTLTDIKELKAMAYDQLAMSQQCQRNLQIIEARMAELQQPSSSGEQ